MKHKRILIVDDEEGMLEVCRDSLAFMDDTEIILQQNSRTAAEQLSSSSFDLLITDIRMPGIDGVELLRIARKHDPDLPVLMLTAFPSVETAVECMKVGAADYLTKPIIPEDLQVNVKRLLDEKHLREENHFLKKQLEQSYRFDDMIGKCDAMKAVYENIQRVAEKEVDVLIVGETGTGKELVARSIHNRSQRKNGNFVPVDCGAIPENLLENEFFGHERGAFTGANSRSMGLLEFADNGTFFLDEVGELPLQLQAKLLRTVQERMFRRVGSREEIKVNVRVIAATNRKLEEEIREKRFKEDFYFRINVARIELPPLRERGNDIILLIDQFFTRYAAEMSREQATLDEDAREVLIRYPWPGNIRELQNVMKRILAMTDKEIISVDDLPDEIVANAGTQSAAVLGSFFHQKQQQVESFEKEYLNTLLRNCSGDISKAANEAKIPRGTLYRLIKKHQIAPDEFRS